jgi:hypothetical protein
MTKGIAKSEFSSRVLRIWPVFARRVGQPACTCQGIRENGTAPPMPLDPGITPVALFPRLPPQRGRMPGPPTRLFTSLPCPAASTISDSALAPAAKPSCTNQRQHLCTASEAVLAPTSDSTLAPTVIDPSLNICKQKGKGLLRRYDPRPPPPRLRRHASGEAYMTTRRVTALLTFAVLTVSIWIVDTHLTGVLAQGNVAAQQPNAGSGRAASWRTRQRCGRPAPAGRARTWPRARPDSGASSGSGAAADRSLHLEKLLQGSEVLARQAVLPLQHPAPAL